MNWRPPDCTPWPSHLIKNASPANNQLISNQSYPEPERLNVGIYSIKAAVFAFIDRIITPGTTSLAKTTLYQLVERVEDDTEMMRLGSLVSELCDVFTGNDEEMVIEELTEALEQLTFYLKNSVPKRYYPQPDPAIKFGLIKAVHQKALVRSSNPTLLATTHSPEKFLGQQAFPTNPLIKPGLIVALHHPPEQLNLREQFLENFLPDRLACHHVSGNRTSDPISALPREPMNLMMPHNHTPGVDQSSVPQGNHVSAQQYLPTLKYNPTQPLQPIILHRTRPPAPGQKIPLMTSNPLPQFPSSMFTCDQYPGHPISSCPPMDHSSRTNTQSDSPHTPPTRQPAPLQPQFHQSPRSLSG